jgi:hypothetical protein
MKPQDLQTIARAALMPPAAPAPTAAAALAAKVDRLGALSAALAAMKKEADHIRTELEDAGLADIHGNLYRVNFAQCTARAVTDWKTVAERLNPSAQLIRAHTKPSKSFVKMTVKAHPTH